MAEMLILDYRGGGSKELHLGDPIEEGLSRKTLARARSLLIARNELAALALLDELDLAIHQGTNDFGDEFITVHASASSMTVGRFRESLESLELPASKLRDASRALRAAVSEAWEQDGEVRFFAVSVS